MESEITTFEPTNWELVGDDTVESGRLAALLAENAERSADERLSPRERQLISLMERPVDSATAFSMLGTYLGLLPPAAIISKMAFETQAFGSNLVFLFFGAVAIAVTTLTGRGLGRPVGKQFEPAYSWFIPNQMLLAALFGAVWGGLSGFAGGLFLFIFGAIFGGIAGSLSAAVALPVFSLAFRWLQVGGKVEYSKILPFALGIPIVIAALILS